LHGFRLLYLPRPDQILLRQPHSRGPNFLPAPHRLFTLPSFPLPLGLLPGELAPPGRPLRTPERRRPHSAKHSELYLGVLYIYVVAGSLPWMRRKVEEEPLVMTTT
jgi:hypothetical protein